MKNNKALQKDLEAKIKELRYSVDAVIKVSVYDLKTDSYAHVNGNKPGWAASIIKVPILITAAEEIANHRLNMRTFLKVEHIYTLEPFDTVSKLPEGSLLSLFDLLHYMAVKSDNEATNIVANKLGVENINQHMRYLGLKNSMLGHLLYPGAERHTSEFNKDGSNITCPDDMVCAFRQIYDPKFTRLSLEARYLADYILSDTHPRFINTSKFVFSKIKAKEGVITSSLDGDDIHEAGIIDNRLIVCIMANKINQNILRQMKTRHLTLADKWIWWKQYLVSENILPYSPEKYQQDRYLQDESKSCEDKQSKNKSSENTAYEARICKDKLYKNRAHTDKANMDKHRKSLATYYTFGCTFREIMDTIGRHYD